VTRVCWSPLAAATFEEFFDFIHRDKPEAAHRWATVLFELVDSLAELPRRGRIVPEAGREDVRELIYGNYRLIYRIGSESVEVLTLRHGRQIFDPAVIEG